MEKETLAQGEVFALTFHSYADWFCEEKKMGKLAASTGGCLCRLGVAIESNTTAAIKSLNQVEEDPSSQLMGIDKEQIQERVEELYARILVTVHEYADQQIDPEYFANYIEMVKDVVFSVDEALTKLDMSYISTSLIGKYGQGVSNELDFKNYLQKLYTSLCEDIKTGVRKPLISLPLEREEVDPRAFVADLIESSVSISKVPTQTGLGVVPVSQPPAPIESMPPLTVEEGEVEEPTIMTGATQLIHSVSLLKNLQDFSKSPDENRQRTNIGFGVPIPPRPDFKVPADAKLPSEFQQKNVVSLPHVESPEVGQFHTIQTGEKLFLDQKESTPAIPIQSAVIEAEIEQKLSEAEQETTPEKVRISSMPPAPAPQEPSARMGKMIELFPSKEQHEVSVPTDQPVVIEKGINSAPDLMPEFTPPSPNATGVNLQPAIKPETSIPKVIIQQREEKPAPFTREWAVKQQVQTGDSKPRNLFAPAAGSKKPEVVSKLSSQSGREEVTKVTRPPEPHTPGVVQTKTRSRLSRSIGAALALGLAGLGGGGLWYYMNNSQNNDTEGGTNASANVTTNTSASSVPSSSSKPLDGNTSVKPNTVENLAQTEKGIFRINVNSEAFKVYLCHFKGASMLASTMKKAAMATQLSFSTNEQERQSAENRGKIALVGNESITDQRMALMETYLMTAQKDSPDNRFIKNYFLHQINGYKEFKRSGIWSAEAIAYGVDKLFEAIQTPEKLLTSADIIGYAPVADQSANPAWKKVSDSAPAFAAISQEAARRLHSPENVIPYDDPRMIKEAICQQIQKIGSSSAEVVKLRLGKTSDVMAGSQYMYNHWCANDCSSENPLDKAIKMTEPVLAEIPVGTPSPTAPKNLMPTSDPIPTNSATPAPLPQPTHSWFKWPWKKQPQLNEQDQTVKPVRHACTAAVQEKQPDFLSRTVSKVKSFFGIGKKNQPQSKENQFAFAADTIKYSMEEDQIITPKESWKETLKSYFWG